MKEFIIYSIIRAIVKENPGIRIHDITRHACHDLNTAVRIFDMIYEMITVTGVIHGDFDAGLYWEG